MTPYGAGPEPSVLPRTPLRRSSHNTLTTYYGAYCWQQQAQVQEGGSMPTRDKRLLTDLRCRKHDHPFKAEIWQTLHYVAHSNEIVGKTTLKGRPAQPASSYVHRRVGVCCST